MTASDSLALAPPRLPILETHSFDAIFHALDHHGREHRYRPDQHRDCRPSSDLFSPHRNPSAFALPALRHDDDHDDDLLLPSFLSRQHHPGKPPTAPSLSLHDFAAAAPYLPSARFRALTRHAMATTTTTTTTTAMTTDTAEPVAVETAPSSPPELSYSKSSKSSSSSFRSSSLSDHGSTEKLSHFEDITLEEAEQESVEYNVAVGDSNLKPESRPTLRRPSPRSSASVLETSKRGLVRPGETREGPDAARASPYPSLHGAVNRVLQDQSLPHRRVMRRGFTTPAPPSFMLHSAQRLPSRSPSPGYPFPQNGNCLSPRSPASSTPKASCDSPRTSLSGPFGRRQSWQPRKTAKQLEAEYNDDDEEVPEEAVLENVPFSPVPGQPRSTSRTPSPLRQLSPRATPYTNLHSANVPKHPRRPSAPGIMRPPRSPLAHRPPMLQHSATISAFPTEPPAMKQRSKSWNDDLSAEARELSAALEEYADRLSMDKHAPGSRSAPGSPPRPSLPANKRPKSSIVALPPVQKGNIMIDPLPISKEKEAVLTRTRPSWLPPKSQKEEKKHVKEWEHMMARAANAEKRRAARQKEASERRVGDCGSAERVWTQQILPNWDTAIREPQTRELWWRGVAPSSRGTVWQKAIGNELQLSASSFQAALSRANALEQTLAGLSAEERSKSNEAAWFAAIARDVPTAFPDLPAFASDAPDGHRALSDVLKAYAMYRSDLGYVYGTHLPAALLCANLPAPADAFVVLANLLNRPVPLAFLAHDPSTMAAAHDRVLAALHAASPKLHAHLTAPALGLKPADYLDPLFRCLFAYNLPPDKVARLWDVYVFEGDDLLVSAAVAVLTLLEPRLYVGRAEIAELIGWGVQRRWALAGEEQFIQVVRDAMV